MEGEYIVQDKGREGVLTTIPVILENSAALVIFPLPPNAISSPTLTKMQNFLCSILRLDILILPVLEFPFPVCKI